MTPADRSSNAARSTGLRIAATNGRTWLVGCVPRVELEQRLVRRFATATVLRPLAAGWYPEGVPVACRRLGVLSVFRGPRRGPVPVYAVRTSLPPSSSSSIDDMGMTVALPTLTVRSWPDAHNR